MANPNHVAFCEEAVCVAEDSTVAFYAPKTLKKYHVERFNGYRVAGLAVVKGATASVLHVVDVKGTWFTMSLAGGRATLASSTTIPVEDEAGNQEVDETVTADAKPTTIRARKPGRLAQGLKEAAAQRAGTGIVEASFTTAEDHKSNVKCVFLVANSVYEVAASDLGKGVKPRVIMRLPPTTSDCFISVGRCTGLVVAGEKGQRWLQYSLPERRSEAEVLRKSLPVDLQSISCSPVTMSVAVGGARGEVIVFPVITERHHFSDHWHHTPLSAIAFSTDGNAVLTGAREATLLVWNTTSSYTYKKISCGLGALNCVVPSISNGSRVLLTCGESTLAVMDLLQMRVVASLEGVQWSRSTHCTGLLVERWSGQTAVILTGLPDVVRVCDPLTQQALYSLHVSMQMETVANPPKCGVQQVAMLDDGRVMATYEEYASMALPSALRFWAYDSATAHHTEMQTVYSPHTSSIIAMHADKKRRRIFTLSASGMKTWKEGAKGDPNDAYNVQQRALWENETSARPPSANVTTMTLSSDGSLCLVADDSVHVYGVSALQRGSSWPLLATLTQACDTKPLLHVELIESCRMVVAHDGSNVYFWSLADLSQTGYGECCAVWKASNSGSDGGSVVSALCPFSPTSVLVAAEGALLELSCVSSEDSGSKSAAAAIGSERGRVAATAFQSIAFMKMLDSVQITSSSSGDKSSKAGARKVAIVDNVSGFRVLNVNIVENTAPALGLSENSIVNPQANGSAPASIALPESLTTNATSVGAFFSGANESLAEHNAKENKQMTAEAAALSIAAQKWLSDVLDGSPYSAPPMTTVLSQLLSVSTGGSTL